MSEKGRFRQAGIPSALADEIVELSEENPWLGYRSLSNFVTAGVRRLLQEMRKEVYQKRMMESDAFQNPPVEESPRLPKWSNHNQRKD